MSSRVGLRMLSLAVPVVLLAPAVAHAEKVVTEDAVGDARSYTVVYDSGEEPEFLLAPDEASADIVRTVAAHGAKRLSVTVHLRDLQTSRPQISVIRVVTPAGTYTVAVEKSPGSRARAEIDTRRGDLECRGLRAGVDGAADTVSVSVPTACIGAPRWVQLGVGVIGFAMPADGTEPTSETLYADDGHRSTISDNSIGRGPRITRG